jgi:hypothetical protein
MRFGPVSLDDLSDLQAGQMSDHKGPQEKTDEKGGKAAVYGSEGNIPEYIQKGEINMIWI